MNFKVRFVVPAKEHNPWVDVPADSVEDAIQEFHYQRDRDGLCIVHEFEPGRKHIISFARIEVEGFEAMISRIYNSPIWRKGGVKPRGPTFKERLAEIARKLDWKDPPEALLEEGWECEKKEWGH